MPWRAPGLTSPRRRSGFAQPCTSSLRACRRPAPRRPDVSPLRRVQFGADEHAVMVLPRERVSRAWLRFSSVVSDPLGPGRLSRRPRPVRRTTTMSHTTTFRRTASALGATALLGMALAAPAMAAQDPGDAVPAVDSTTTSQPVPHRPGPRAPRGERVQRRPRAAAGWLHLPPGAVHPSAEQAPSAPVRADRRHPRQRPRRVPPGRRGHARWLRPGRGRRSRRLPPEPPRSHAGVTGIRTAPPGTGTP